MSTVNSGPDNPNPATPASTGPSIAAILATIRELESGNYSAGPNAGGASGAYQYIQSTWTSNAIAAGFPQYAHAPAYEAPADVQDAVATYNVNQILKTYGTVADVPLAWYYPAAIGNPALLNTVPDPGAGNSLTPAQYQAKWLAAYTANAANSANLTGAVTPATGSADLGTGTAVGGGPGLVGQVGSAIGNVAGDIANVGGFGLIGALLGGASSDLLKGVLALGLNLAFVVGALALIVLGLSRLFPTARDRLATVLPLAAAAAA